MDPIKVQAKEVVSTMFRDKDYKENFKNNLIAGIFMAITVVFLPITIVGSALVAYNFYKDYQMVKQRLQTPLPEMHITVEQNGDQSVLAYRGLKMNETHQLLAQNPGKHLKMSDKLEYRLLADGGAAVVAKNPQAAIFHSKQKYCNVPLTDGYLAKHAQDYVDAGERAKNIQYSAALMEGHPVPPDRVQIRYTQVIDCHKSEECFDEMLKAVKDTFESKKGNALDTVILPSATRPYLVASFVDPARGIEQVKYLKSRASRFD